MVGFYAYTARMSYYARTTVTLRSSWARKSSSACMNAALIAPITCSRFASVWIMGVGLGWVGEAPAAAYNATVCMHARTFAVVVAGG